MATHARVYLNPDIVAARLGDLELTESVLLEAISRGLVARLASTRFDPPSYPGYEQWAKTHRALRELLVPQGWRADDTGGFSTVISPDGATAITVATGDDRTGREGLPHPSTKYPRGPLTHAAVQDNAQLMIPGLQVAGEDRSHTTVRTTWILLLQTRHDEVRCELSCPSSIGADGRVDAWRDRIVLNALELDTSLPFPPNGEDENNIDVPIEPV